MVEVSQPPGESVKKSDRQILQSTLNDGQYDISPEDRASLESVIATLYSTTVHETSNEEDTDP